jgi:hypothetical protein
VPTDQRGKELYVTPWHDPAMHRCWRAARGGRDGAERGRAVRRRRRDGRPRLLAGGLIGAALLLAAGLLAGCGGGAHASSPTKVMSATLAYANCMRSHGVPDFPDPDGQGYFVIHGGPGSDLAPSSPAFRAAERVCGPFGSAGRQVTATQENQEYQKSLKAAACMRANGVRNYPEPKLINGTIKLSFTASINPATPAVRTAAKKCGYQDEQEAEQTRLRMAFVCCMRTHGVTKFPYPTANGHVSVAMVRARGINPQAPAVARVVSECLPPWLRPPRGP